MNSIDMYMDLFVNRNRRIYISTILKIVGTYNSYLILRASFPLFEMNCVESFVAN